MCVCVCAHVCFLVFLWLPTVSSKGTYTHRHPCPVTAWDWLEGLVQKAVIGRGGKKTQEEEVPGAMVRSGAAGYTCKTLLNILPTTPNAV